MRPHSTLAAAELGLFAAGAAMAECPADAKGSVRVLSNDFPALNAINERALSCAKPELAVTANQTTQHTDLQVPALTANPAEYTVKFGANGSMTALLTAGLLRPLDNLVARYGQDLQPTQLIKIDGKVMAIAFMANAEHFYFCEDVLADLGITAPPQTWAT